MAELKITYVSHACIRLEGEFGALITDPWILNEPIYTFTTWKFPAAVMPPEELIKNLDYLFISHAHEDHLHIPSLSQFPRDVTVLLANYVENASLRAHTIERVMRELGFYKIRKLRPWETVMLGGNTPLTLIPACKMKYWDWENSGFVLEHSDCKVLNMNDCPSDKELYAEVKRRFGGFDLGFIQYSGVSMFPGCYRMPIEEMREASTTRKHSWIQQKNMFECLDVKRVAPFAGDFAWLDDRMYHCNWSNRSTPKLFENFVKDNYGDRNTEVLIMYPSDTWTVKEGLQRNHPEIDWNNYLALIDKVKRKFQPKVDAIREWIESSSVEDLKERSRTFTDYLNQWIAQDGIDFTTRIRVEIEGDRAGFSFVMKASPETGFRIDWEDSAPCDQTLFIRQSLWAAVLEAKVVLNNIQWASENKQHVEFRLEIARFWFWFETHIDLNNRNPQALVDRALHPWLTERIRPRLGVFPIDGEWDCSWLEEFKVLPPRVV